MSATLIAHMMTSSNGNISALLALCAGNSPVTGEFPSQRPVTRSFDVFFDLRPNKRLSKQSWSWWFETPSRSLWRQCNAESKLKNVIKASVFKRLRPDDAHMRQWIMSSLVQVMACPVRRQAINRTNVDLLLIRAQETYFNKIPFKIRKVLFKKNALKCRLLDHHCRCASTTSVSTSEGTF